MSIGKTSSKSSTTGATDPAVQSAYNSLLQQAQTTANTPLSLYSGQLVAPLTSDQNTGISDIQNAQGLAQPYLTQAAQYAQNGATPITTTPFSANAVNQYESPYQADVLSTTEAAENQQDQQAQQSLQGNITAAGAWGGDRSAVLQSQLAGQQALANNQTNAGIENTGYTNALNQFNTANQLGVQTQQANNQNNQATGYELGSLGTAMENTALTGGSALLNAGTAQQQVNQENLNVPYEQYLQQQAYPYQNEDFLASLLPGITSGTGTTSNSSSFSPFNYGSLVGLGNAYGAKDGGRIRLMDGGDSGSGGGLGSLIRLGAMLAMANGGRTRLASGGGSLSGYPMLPQVPSIGSYVPGASGSGGLSSPHASASGASGASSGAGGSAGKSGGSSSPFGSFLWGNPQSGATDASGGLIGQGGQAATMAGWGQDLGALIGLQHGGRPRLADGGNDDDAVFEDILNRTYPGPDQTAAVPAVPVAPAPAPQTDGAMSLADTPPDWRSQATNYATGASDSTPTWDDGQPVVTGTPDSPDAPSGGLASPASGNVLWQAPDTPTDWGHVLLSGLAGFASTGNLGKGLAAGMKDYDAEKDPNPEVDHSGSTVMVKYGSPGQRGQLIDTGIPTEAALNAQAANSFKVANMQTASDDRQAAIAQRAQAAKDRAADMAQAEADRAAYQKGLLALGSQRADSGQYAGMQPGKGVDANGQPVDGVYSLDKRTGKPLFTPGAVLDPKGAGAAGMSGREGVYFNRVAAAGNEAATAAANIMELPRTVSTGIFGGRTQAPGLLGAAKESLTNAATSQDVQSYNTMIAGVSRNLAAIESSGLAPNGSLTHSMDSVILKEGDSDITKMRKMAEMRQIVEKGLEPNLANPKIPDEQKTLVKNIIGQMQTAIPFTQHDITALQHAKNPQSTIADIVKARRLGGNGGGSKFQEGRVLHQNGNLYKVTNGVPVYQGAAP